MSGRPGRSGGWNRLSDAEHARRGTQPRGRASSALQPAPAERDEPAPADLVAGLDVPGRSFVQRCWETYTGWTPEHLALLREAAVLMDQIQGLRGQKGEREAQGMLLKVLTALRLG